MITIDPRGNGRSDRPADPAAYGKAHAVADTLAVMDELGVDSAVLVGLCSSAWTALLVAAEAPDRVDGLVAVSPWLPYVTPPLAHRVVYPADEVPDTEEGCLGQCAPEPHSSKVIEDCVGWRCRTLRTIS